MAARSVVGLGIAGGLVPCWDAVLLVVLSAVTGRLGLGIVLLMAFGTGMAVVLVAVGIAAARLRSLFLARNDLAGGVVGRWERRLGIASGVTLGAIGVYLLGLA